MKAIFILFFTCLLTAHSSFSQKIVVNGKVTDNKNIAIPGVSINVKGSDMGTTTNLEGDFNLNVSTNAVLVFSFVGYEEKEVEVNNRNTINISLNTGSNSLEEVIVTALGITRRTRSLVYATQSIEPSQLNEVRDPGNLLNSFQGKVANALITQGSGGVGSEARMVLRGNRSIQGNNSVLVVIDGVPNSSISSVNPDDIESVTILPGASAAALYGSQAGNGVMVITTKGGKLGRVGVSFNSGITRESPFIISDVQNKYGQGSGGLLNSSVGSSWGAKMEGQNYKDAQGEDKIYSSQPNNINDFFRKGVSLNNHIGISSGTEKTKTYLSYTNNKVDGIFLNNDLISHTINLRLSNQITKKLSTDAKVTYFTQDIKNIPRAGEGNTAIIDIYQIPRSFSTKDAKDYFIKNSLGEIEKAPWPSTLPAIYGNPYWAIYNDVLKEKRDQISGFLAVKYQILSWISLSGRANLDKKIVEQQRTTYNGTQLRATKSGGYYSKSMEVLTQKWFDVLLEGNKAISADVKIDFNVGAIYQDNQMNRTNSIADGLNIKNKFDLLYATTPQISSNGTQVQTQSVFGQANIAYKNYLFLEGSWRNDWDSRLPAPHAFQYYSAGISGIISDMVTLPELITFLKTNINYAEVGNGGQFGLLSSSYTYQLGAGNGYLQRSDILPIPGLKPEIVKNTEAGLEIRFLDNRLGLSFTAYKSNSYNQLLRINLPTATGYSSQYLNAGNIENKGIEIVVSGSPIHLSHFSWETNLNLGINRNKVIELSDELKVVRLVSYYDFGGAPEVSVGGSYGDIYGYQWKRNDRGQFIVNSKGTPLTTNVAGEDPGYIGNFNPKSTMGFSNIFKFKSISFRILIDGRIGGILIDGTEQNLAFDGITSGTLPFRGGGWNLGGVDLEGKPVPIEITAQDFWQTASRKRSGVGEFFAYDATNFRIRELSLGYSFNDEKQHIFKSARLSLVARNVLWLYRGYSILDIPGVKKRKMSFDPDISMGNDNNQGVLYAPFPSIRSIGVNLNLNF